MFRWNRDLDLQVLSTSPLLLTHSHSLCEELYFSELFYAQSLRLALAVFRPALADPLVRSKSSPSSPQEPAPSEPSARLCP